MADGEPSAAELAAMAAELAELRLMCEDPQILRLPAALRRANLQSWRCTLHRDRLVSALALAHKISPPRGTLEAQLAFVRARLRAHAVFLACGAPFGAWAQFARRSTRERDAALISEATAASRSARIRTERADGLRVRQQVLDASLRRLGVRRRLEGALATWRAARAMGALRTRRALLCCRAWLHWRAAAEAWRRVFPSRRRRQLRRRLALYTWARAADADARRRALLLSLRVRPALGRWRDEWRKVRRLEACMMVLWRRGAVRALALPLHRWRRAIHSRATAGRDVARASRVCAEARAWARAARSALAELHSLGGGDPDAIVGALSALGGAWNGGAPALRVAASELCKYGADLDDERDAAAAAQKLAAKAATRCDTLLDTLAAQRATAAATAVEVARAEAELLCVQREGARLAPAAAAAALSDVRAAAAIGRALDDAETAMRQPLRLADERCRAHLERLERLHSRVATARAILDARARGIRLPIAGPPSTATKVAVSRQLLGAPAAGKKATRDSPGSPSVPTPSKKKKKGAKSRLAGGDAS